MNHLGFEILIPFSRSVAQSRIARLLFTIGFDSRLSISIALRCVFAITYTSMDGYTSTSTMFSFLASICIICASTNCCSTTLSSFDSSMNTSSIDVALHPTCYLVCQFLLLLHRNSITNVLVLYILWIIICTNYIFSLYVFPSTHSENDDECGNDLTTNDWIFNKPSNFTLFNSSFASFFLNNSTSSSCFCLCSLFCTSFSSIILYSFLIAFFALMFLWSPELWKRSQLPTRNKKTTFDGYAIFFVLEHFAHCIHFFTYPLFFN